MMMKNKYINTFLKGMNSDYSVNKYPSDSYVDALDFRIISDEEFGTLCLTNIKGNKARIQLPDNNHNVLGGTQVGDYLVLFTENLAEASVAYMTINMGAAVSDGDVIWLTFGGLTYKFWVSATLVPGDTPPTGYYGIVSETSTETSIASDLSYYSIITDSYNITTSPNGIEFTAINTGIEYAISSAGTSSLGLTPNYIYFAGSNGTSYILKTNLTINLGSTLTPTTVYSDAYSTSKLNLSRRIYAVGNIESDNINKVYWIDGEHPMRMVDINRDYSDVEASSLDYIPNYNQNVTIETETISGGNYTAGVVQHVFQFFYNNGVDTTFSQLSNPIKLTSFDDNEGGDNIGDEISKSVRIKISNINSDDLTSFNTIRVYAIFYTEFNSSPTVGLVGEFSMSAEIFSCTDTGTYSDTITFEEFLTYKESLLIPNTIESKDNNLLLGNIKEDVFNSDAIDDWDARAYRFNTSNLARIYDVDDDTYIDVNTDFVNNSTLASIPTTHDCYNKYNSIYNYDVSYRNSYFDYKYQSNGSTLGGEGINIKYSFETYSKDIAINSQNIGIYNKSDIYTASDGSTEKFLIECQTGDVYRLGIKFYNDKGQSSFVKWIGDVLFEDLFNYDDGELGFPSYKTRYSVSDTAVKSQTHVLTVNIKTLPIDDNIKYWQIVRVPREKQDKSIVSTGILEPTALFSAIFGTTTNYRPYYHFSSTTGGSQYRAMVDTEMIDDDIATDGVTPVSKRIMRFISPEFMFNNPNDKNILNYKLSVTKLLDTIYDYQEAYGSSDHIISYSYCSSLYTSSTSDSGHYDIISYSYVKPQHAQDNSKSLYHNIDGDSFINQAGAMKTGDLDVFAGANSCIVIKLGSDLTVNSSDASSQTLFYADMIQDVDISRYGGVTYNDRFSNEYIPFSEKISINDDETICIYGDVWTNMFDFVHLIHQDDSDNSDESMQDLMTFPVQSSIDLRYRLDRINHYAARTADDVIDKKRTMYVQETVEEGILFQPEVYDETIGDLYKYNTVYSKSVADRYSYPKPFNFIDNSFNNTKIINSEPKINLESSDSWAVFKVNNFIELQGKYGKLNSLVNYRDKVYAFQDRGVAIVSVNERELIRSSSDATSLALGTGGTLERYDYLSTNVGAQRASAVVRGNYSIYFVNENDYSIYDVRNLSYPISKSKNINSKIKPLIKNYVENGGILETTFDQEYSEILFTIYDNTYCFNEELGTFTSRYGFVPDMYFNFNGKLLSYKNGATTGESHIYQHNISDKYGIYYGLDFATTYIKPYLRILVNPNGNEINSFDTLDYRTEVYNSGDNPIDDTPSVYDTFDVITFRNSYMNETVNVVVNQSGTIDSTTNTARRSRIFRTQVPQKNESRFFDTHMIIDFTFDTETHTGDKKIRVHDIMTYFRQQNM